ncbi:MAG: hypothetical protein KKA79_09555 [Nanoarchaeota archaeon]|nr:hypothetical protein [Nanoarchaeota archaeon]MCG2718816.1 hypothetical protein [Nanoarchaeota archaeon]
MATYLYVIKKPIDEDNRCECCKICTNKKFDIEYDLVKDHSNDKLEEVKSSYGEGTSIEVHELPKESLEHHVLSIKLKHRLLKKTKGIGLDKIAP